MNRDRFPMPEIDRVVHEPARLAILTVLSSCAEADFLFLERATGLSRGNLSVQLTRLEDAGVIEIEKKIERKRTLTIARLTGQGRRILTSYWESMDTLRAVAETTPARAHGMPKPGRRLRPGWTPAKG
jgi:DNA-binding transcriptional ArsR family regulator